LVFHSSTIAMMHGPINIMSVLFITTVQQARDRCSGELLNVNYHTFLFRLQWHTSKNLTDIMAFLIALKKMP